MRSTTETDEEYDTIFHDIGIQTEQIAGSPVSQLWNYLKVARFRVPRVNLNGDFYIDVDRWKMPCDVSSRENTVSAD